MLAALYLFIESEHCIAKQILFRVGPCVVARRARSFRLSLSAHLSLLAVSDVPSLVPAVTQEFVNFGKLTIRKLRQMRIVGLFDKRQLVFAQKLGFVTLAIVIWVPGVSWDCWVVVIVTVPPTR